MLGLHRREYTINDIARRVVRPPQPGRAPTIIGVHDVYWDTGEPKKERGEKSRSVLTGGAMNEHAAGLGVSNDAERLREAPRVKLQSLHVERSVLLGDSTIPDSRNEVGPVDGVLVKVLEERKRRMREIGVPRRVGDAFGRRPKVEDGPDSVVPGGLPAGVREVAGVISPNDSAKRRRLAISRRQTAQIAGVHAPVPVEIATHAEDDDGASSAKRRKSWAKTGASGRR